MALIDFKLWKFMTISLDNVAEVFKSERTFLVETIILSKVLRRIRDDKKIKCERIAFNNRLKVTLFILKFSSK